MKTDTAISDVEALANDSGFARRIVGAIQRAPRLTTAFAKQAVASELDLYKTGATGAYKLVRFQGDLTPEEVQAVISLAAHTVLLSLVPAAAATGLFGQVSAFLGKRVFSSLSWRGINKAVSQLVSRIKPKVESLFGPFERQTMALWEVT